MIINNHCLIQRKGEGVGVIGKLTVGRFCTVNLFPSSILVFIAAAFFDLLTAYIQLNFAGSQSWCCQQQSCTDANLVQLGTLRRADRAIPIDFFLGAEGFTGTFFRLCVGRSLWVPAVLCIANLANIGARRSLCGGNITAAFIVLVLTVQCFDDAAGILAAHMGADCRVGQATAALIMGSVDALPGDSVTLVGVLMGAGLLRGPLGVAAIGGVFGVVFAQITYTNGGTTILGESHGRHHGYHHAQAGQYRKQSLFHFLSSSPSMGRRIFSLPQTPSKQSSDCR